ncbi:SAM-dependent methyltransferase [Microbispora rosea]|uniref:SAM-dependent methyltransferase n=1 Tax=Microbispora rosea TaxID=58117 RepID=UPI003420762A
MSRDEEALKAIDFSTPSVARIYDWWLGGKDNFAVDRAAAEKLLELVGSDGRLVIRQNREFLGRAVRFLSESGIRQFLDLGTGVPTQGNVHEVAHEVDPEATVVYVDNDPIVAAHGRALLTGTGRTGVVQADMRDPDAIVESPVTKELIDFSKPVAVLFVAVLHFVDDDDAERVVSYFRERMAPGSHLVISHGTQGRLSEDTITEARAVYEKSTAALRDRTPEHIARFFTGFELVEPGLVDVADWRNDSDFVEHSKGGYVLGGVGRLA